jgi:hypothetical protein
MCRTGSRGRAVRCLIRFIEIEFFPQRAWKAAPAFFRSFSCVPSVEDRTLKDVESFQLEPMIVIERGDHKLHWIEIVLHCKSC